MGLLDISSRVENWLIGQFIRPTYEKQLDGTDFYYISDTDSWSPSETNLKFALNHIILTPALLFMANLVAQARFTVVKKKTGEEVVNHKLIKLLNDPNYYQSRIDFIEALQFLKIAQGRAIIWAKKITGMSAFGNGEVDSFYVLRSDKIKFPEGFQTKLSLKSKRKDIGNQKIIYDENGLNLTIKLKDLIFIYDIPNVIDHKNMFTGSSRLDGLHQTLINSSDSAIAKNIILKTNGKEMITGDTGATGGFPFSGEEQKEAQRTFNNNYGLGIGRSRMWMTKAKVIWKSLAINVRDLGFDESTKVDGNIIYTNLHIPKDVLSLEAKKTTYANFKESLTSYIQNDIMAHANDIAESLNSLVGEDEEVLASFEHLPVMQFILIERYLAIQGRAKALNDLLKTGIKEPEALELCGFPKNMELNERQDLEPEASTTTNQSKRSEEDVEEEE